MVDSKEISTDFFSSLFRHAFCSMNTSRLLLSLRKKKENNSEDYQEAVGQWMKWHGTFSRSRNNLLPVKRSQVSEEA